MTVKCNKINTWYIIAGESGGASLRLAQEWGTYKRAGRAPSNDANSVLISGQCVHGQHMRINLNALPRKACKTLDVTGSSRW